MAHRYSYPIRIALPDGAKTTGQFVKTVDSELTPEELEAERIKAEENLNTQISNPLLPGAKYELLQPAHQKVKG